MCGSIIANGRQTTQQPPGSLRFHVLDVGKDSIATIVKEVKALSTRLWLRGVVQKSTRIASHQWRQRNLLFFALPLSARHTINANEPLNQSNHLKVSWSLWAYWGRDGGLLFFRSFRRAERLLALTVQFRLFQQSVWPGPDMSWCDPGVHLSWMLDLGLCKLLHLYVCLCFVC